MLQAIWLSKKYGGSFMPYMLVLQAVQPKVLLLGQAELLPDHISQGLYQLDLLSFCSLALLPPYAELIQL